MYKNKFKKIIGASLCTTMLLTSTIFAKEFKDVQKGGPYGWAYSYIDEMSDKGVIEGYPNGNYEPDRAVSFQEVLKLIMGVINAPSSEVTKAVQRYGSDLSYYGIDGWAKEAAAIAIEKDVITLDTVKEAQSKGFIDSENIIYPDRNTIAVYYARALRLSSSGDESYLRHEDKDKIPSTTRGYLASLVKAGIFSSTGSDGKFEGTRHIRRSEMAKITKLSYDYSKSAALNTETKTITGKVVLPVNINNVKTIIIEKDGSNHQFKVDSSTTYKMNNSTVKFEDLKKDQEVKITYVQDSDSTVEGLAKTVEVTSSSKDLIGYVTSKGTDSISISYRNNDKDVDLSKDTKISTTTSGTFKFASNAKIYRLGKQASLNDIYYDDIIEFKTDSSGNISEADILPKSGQVTGTVVSIASASTQTNNRESITLRLDNNKDYTFYGSYSSVSNPFYSTSLFKDIRTGERVTFSTNYKFITSTSARPQNVLVGEITDAYLSSYNYSRYDDRTGEIKFKSAYSTNTYYLTKDTKYKFGNSSLYTASPSVYQLKGLKCEIEINGDRVVEIRETNQGSQIDIIAQVTKIETDYAFSTTRYTYTIKTINSNNSNVSKNDEFRITREGNYPEFSWYDILRVRGLKDSSGSGLSTVSIDKIDNTGRFVSDYYYDFNRYY
ncbi:S-layer homology domain-containing protein [Peptoniphilus catoniae]|uniref:S-layer homology domain-containing protein n=1 Tax=Peptoniphilus catoniae TaxID=1660341 RepID=UPI0010FF46D0|nr:S-layer homology domain-containing protein [Peptoniphilus catoniae]